MYEAYMRQVSNDHINKARQIAAAHRQAKAAGATSPNRATRFATRAARWLAAAAQQKSRRPAVAT